MAFHVIVTKFLDVPKNIFVETYDSEDIAISIAKEKVIALDASYAVVVKVENGISKVAHRFEPIKKA
ncbi:MAG: hypothetical protein AAB255_03795 [Bacteroidota bacterium]